jgi:hypothetical protein
MRERLNALLDQIFAAPAIAADALHRGATAASRVGHDASRFGSASWQAAPAFAADVIDRGAAAAARVGHDASRLGSASLDAFDHAQTKLARYGLTPEMIAGLAAPQLRQIQRAAMKTATRNPGSIAGSLLVIGALGLIAYAITRESQQLAAPNVIRSRN